MIHPDELKDDVTNEFERQGEVPPGDAALSALRRVIAGFLRTSPLQAPASLTSHGAIGAFVGACPGWWVRDLSDYPMVASLLDDVFQEHGITGPAPELMAMLHRLTVGILRGRRAPRTHAAQLAVSDWVASLYLAGGKDW